MQDIKEKVREKYGKVALLQETCCMPGECGCGTPVDAAEMTGYNSKELASVPQASILGAGCGAPLGFTDVKEGEVVVDLGSGAGIDVFLAANKVGKLGRVIGIDMTDEMLAKARSNALEHGYSNAEFRKGDIEKEIPVDSGTVDLVISNCVINLTSSKSDTFRQVHRILKVGGRMVISDLVTDREVEPGSADAEQWCSCIDGALTKEHYIQSMHEAGFADIEVLQERPHSGAQADGRKITSVVIKAVKKRG